MSKKKQNQRNQMDAADDHRLNIRNILKDIEFLGSSHMTWKERKDMENRKVVSLGGKAELGSSRQSTSRSVSNKALKDWQDAWHDGEREEMENQGIDLHDKFWQKLKLTAERKMGAAEADKFCKAFQHVHKKLVYEGLSFDAAQKFLNS